MKRTFIGIISIVFSICSIWANADTDVSQYSEIVYIKSLSANAGDEITLSVQLNNVNSVIGYNFKLYLPEGVTVKSEENEWGDVVVDATLSGNRTTATRHTFETALSNERTINVLCYSIKNYTFAGNSGEVATIKAQISSSLTPGTYPILIRNEAISLTESTPQIEMIQSSLIVLGNSEEEIEHDTVFVEVHDTIYVDMVSVHSANPTMGKVDILVKAVPELGYQFLCWSDFETENPRTVDMSDGLPKSFTAVFKSGGSTSLQDLNPEKTAPQKTINKGVVYIVTPSNVYDSSGRVIPNK